MKRYCILGIICLMACASFGQHAKSNFVTSVSSSDRITMVENSIDVPSWHEKSFWPLYEKYLIESEKVSLPTYRILNALAHIDKTSADEEAYQYARQLIDYRYSELALRKQFFIDIGAALNGVIALQFLQTEALLDMMESSNIYDKSSWRKFRFHPKMLSSTQIKTAKYNTIVSALSISAEQAEAFYKVYTKYEQACDALLGEDYNIYGLYAGEASDFTSGLAKRLGYDLIQVMEREVKLKDKYFMEMNEAVGPSLAAGFLAWEDYYSIVSKMYVWSDPN